MRSLPLRIFLLLLSACFPFVFKRLYFHRFDSCTSGEKKSLCCFHCLEEICCCQGGSVGGDDFLFAFGACMTNVGLCASTPWRKFFHLLITFVSE